MKDKLESMLRNAMEEKKVLPVRAGNKKTHMWLEKRGCVASWIARTGRQWHPMWRLEMSGYKNGLQEYFTLQGIFTVRDGEDGSRNPRPPFEWIRDGLMLEIKCKSPKKWRLQRPDYLTVWMPRDLADKILVLGHIP